MVEFVDLEFGTHGFLINDVFLPTEQAKTNICWIIYQGASFKICLSLFGWKENILPKMHIVQWSIWVQCLSKMAEWQTLPHIELTNDKSSSPLVSKIVRWVTRKTGSPIYIRQIRVPKPAQPTIRPFPRFVLNLVSCVKKVMQICCDLDMWRPAHPFVPIILFVLETIKVFVVVE